MHWNGHRRAEDDERRTGRADGVRGYKVALFDAVSLMLWTPEARLGMQEATAGHVLQAGSFQSIDSTEE